jgi:hypothetical protein
MVPPERLPELGMLSPEPYLIASRFHSARPGFTPADLPELARSMAPTRLVLAGAVDAGRRTRPPEEVRNEYGNAPNVRVLPDCPRSPEAILARLV